MGDNSQGNFDDELLAKLQDSAKRIELWQWLNSQSAAPHNSFTPCGMFPGAFVPHLTPSGTTQGADQSQPSSSGPQPTCFSLMWWPLFPPFFAPQHMAPSSHSHNTSPPVLASSSNSTLTELANEEEDEENERENDDDHVTLYDTESKTMFAEFNPEIKQSSKWDPPEQMSSYLDKHFNKNLRGEEAEEILEDYPMPNFPAMDVPRLDEELKKQLRSKGKDPHFGQEKTLFNIQEELLKVGGPLTCLWADMINLEVEADKEKIVLLVQRALVLLGSASHSITLERWKIAWARINPSLKSLATEKYEDRKDNLASWKKPPRN